VAQEHSLLSIMLLLERWLCQWGRCHPPHMRLSTASVMMAAAAVAHVVPHVPPGLQLKQGQQLQQRSWPHAWDVWPAFLGAVSSRVQRRSSQRRRHCSSVWPLLTPALALLQVQRPLRQR
jgi:hypothetical protein